MQFLPHSANTGGETLTDSFKTLMKGAKANLESERIMAGGSFIEHKADNNKLSNTRENIDNQNTNNEEGKK